MLAASRASTLRGLFRRANTWPDRQPAARWDRRIARLSGSAGPLDCSRVTAVGEYSARRDDGLDLALHPCSTQHRCGLNNRTDPGEFSIPLTPGPWLLCGHCGTDRVGPPSYYRYLPV